MAISPFACRKAANFAQQKRKKKGTQKLNENRFEKSRKAHYSSLSFSALLRLYLCERHRCIR